MAALNAAGLLISFPSPVFVSGHFNLGFLNSIGTNAIESDHKRNVAKKKMPFYPIKAVEECPATKGSSFSSKLTWHCFNFLTLRRGFVYFYSFLKELGFVYFLSKAKISGLALPRKEKIIRSDFRYRLESTGFSFSNECPSS